MIKPSSRTRFMIPVLAFVLPTVLCLAMAEIGLRLSGFVSPVLRAEMFVWSTTDKVLPYTLRPNYSSTYAGAMVNVGPDGNRIIPRGVGSQARKTVVILGDSVAFGQGLADSDTIGAKLQNEIGRSGASRAVSIAAPGYSSWNEAAALMRYSDIASVRAVVLIYVDNDITFDNDHMKLGETGGHIHYMRSTWFHAVTNVIHDHVRVFNLAVDVSQRLRHAWSRPASAGKAEVDLSALAYSMQAIENLAQFCSERGIKLLVALFRDGLYYAAPSEWATYENAILEQLAARRIAAFPLSSATALPLGDYRLAWNDPKHPSTKAAELIALQIAEELRRLR